MTQIKITNSTDINVICFITLGATEGCVQDVENLKFSSAIKIIKISPLQGYFSLKAKISTDISAPAGLGFNGNVSINTPPLNCSGSTVPHGVNIAEFIINNGFQGANAQETVDMSCVAGANCKMKFSLSANDWSTNGGAINVKEFENNEWNNNTGINGVFPYGCDDCTASVSPPSCVGKHPQYANTLPICNVQRNAVSNEGGLVEISFLGLY